MALSAGLLSVLVYDVLAFGSRHLRDLLCLLHLYKEAKTAGIFPT